MAQFIKLVALKATKKLGFQFRARKFLPLYNICVSEIRSYCEYVFYKWDEASSTILNLVDFIKKKGTSPILSFLLYIFKSSRTFSSSNNWTIRTSRFCFLQHFYFHPWQTNRSLLGEYSKTLSLQEKLFTFQEFQDNSLDAKTIFKSTCHVATN